MRTLREGESTKLSESAIGPYTIDVPESILSDLNRRLETTRWSQSPDLSWDGGMDATTCASSAITGEKDTTGATRNRNSTNSRTTERRSTTPAYISCMNAAKDLRHSRSFLPTAIPILLPIREADPASHGPGCIRRPCRGRFSCSSPGHSGLRILG